MAGFRSVSGEDRVKYLIILLIYFAVVVASMVLFLPVHWYVVFAVMVAGALVIIGLNIRDYGVRCANCGAEFSLSFLQELFSFHAFGWQYVKCRECGMRTRATIIRKERGEKGGAPGAGSR